VIIALAADDTCDAAGAQPPDGRGVGYMLAGGCALAEVVTFAVLAAIRA